MSLTDPMGNKPGSHNEPNLLTEKYTRGDNGQVFTGVINDVRYARNRPGNVSKPVRYLPGTSTPWRDPSSFSRNIIWHYTHETSEDYHFTSPPRTDTLDTYSSRFVGNNPALHEFLPLFPSGGYTAPEYDYNDYARCVTECSGKIADAKANLSEDLATYRQTVGSLAQNSSNLLNALLHAKRGQWGAIPKDLGITPKGLGGYLLQWRYGWKPLCADIHAIADSLGKMEPKAKLITARRTVKGSRQVDSSYRGDNNRLMDWSTKSDYYTKCQLTGQIRESWLRSANQWGAVNPLSLGWELVPWSFVVDWFMPIGNVLSALTATAGLDFVGGFTSCGIQGRKTINIGPPSPSWAITGSATTYEVDRFGFRRDALGGWPVPLPYVKSPFSQTHTENALALLLQLVK